MKPKRDSASSLQDLIEKIVVLNHAFDRKEVSQTVANQFIRYAEFLCSQVRHFLIRFILHCITLDCIGLYLVL
jgi:hypothetical protein